MGRLASGIEKGSAANRDTHGIAIEKDSDSQTDGWPQHTMSVRLMLLGSPPDMVHGLPLRGTVLPNCRSCVVS